MNTGGSKKTAGVLAITLLLVGTLLSGSTLFALSSENDETRIMIRYRTDETVVDVMDLMETYNGEFIKEIEQGQLLVYTIPTAEYDMLQKDIGWYSDFIEYIELDREIYASFTPDDTFWGSQWNMPMIDLDYTWDVVLGDPTIILAILDTGVDYNHEDLVANVDETLGWDYVNDDSDPLDDDPYGHGTSVAGVACAEIDNSTGVAGVAQVTVMPMKVLNSSGTGSTSDIVDAIYDAGDWGANVINMSLGSYWYSGSLKTACDWAYETMGIVVVAAAGNDDSDSRHYPAAHDNVIGVGAVMSTGYRWLYSNYGDNVELMAPGVGVWSTEPGDAYGTGTGTSIASPHVAATAALAFSFRSSFSATRVRNIMHNWADDMGQPGYDDYTGYGLLDCWGQID